MKKLNPNAVKVLLYIIVALIAVFAFCAILSSCKVTKSSQSSHTDSVHVKIADSGVVKNNTSSSKTDYDWWRETLNYQPGSRTDTTIYNYQTITQPVQIIREGGKLAQQSNSNNYDSSWKNSYDSLKAELKQSKSSKVVKVLTIWQIAAIGAGAALAVLIVYKLGSKFKIVKA